MKTLRTLCSGGELFGVGARQAGYVHLDGYEIDSRIAAVARLNGFDVRVADVCAIDYAALPPADHLHISPSCKTASQANAGGGETDGDRAVADASARAIRAHQGETFTLENVWAYRTYDSFGRILAALREAGFSYAYWHLNAADYGVPQTRKRLILVARRGLCRITRPRPTHRKGGDMFHPRWVGWYAAIEDILDTLPPTQPAPWQMARLPKALRESLLIGTGGYDGGIVSRHIDAPAFTLTHGGEGGTTGNSAQLRAFLVQSKNVSQQWGDGTRDEDEPAFSIVTDHKPSHMPKAFLVSNAKTEYGDGVRQADEPMLSVTTQMAVRARTYIVGGGNTAGRWVRMTIQALGRFQTVSDDYRGLTAEINGNGVPCRLARCIMESLQ